LVSDGPDKPTARFTPKKAGIYVFQLRVTLGKKESSPVEVRVEVLKAGAMPKAVAIAQPVVLKAAQKNAPNAPVLILNGSQSTAGSAAREEAAKLKRQPVMAYVWKQVAGEDLGLDASALAKAKVGMHIFVPGIYRFSLTVNDGKFTSQPAFVDVKVVEETAESK
jgi:hypothetical protein